MRFWLVFPSPENSHPRKCWGAEVTTLTERRASLGPAHRWHDDKAEALVLAAPDLHVVGLDHGAHHTAAAAAATADAAGAATAWAHRVQGVLAALRGPLLLRQWGRLVATVMGWGWRGYLVLGFGGCARDVPLGYPPLQEMCPVTPSSFPDPLHNQTKRVSVMTAPGLTWLRRSNWKPLWLAFTIQDLQTSIPWENKGDTQSLLHLTHILCISICIWTQICSKTGPFWNISCFTDRKMTPWHYAKWNKSDRENKYCMVSLTCRI